MSTATEQLIRDYLNRLSVAARGQLTADDRRALVSRTREFIDQRAGFPRRLTTVEVGQLLRGLGDPAGLVRQERDRLAAVRGESPADPAPAAPASRGWVGRALRGDPEKGSTRGSSWHWPVLEGNRSDLQAKLLRGEPAATGAATAASTGTGGGAKGAGSAARPADGRTSSAAGRRPSGGSQRSGGGQRSAGSGAPADGRRSAAGRRPAAGWRSAGAGTQPARSGTPPASGEPPASGNGASGNGASGNGAGGNGAGGNGPGGTDRPADSSSPPRGAGPPPPTRSVPRQRSGPDGTDQAAPVSDGTATVQAARSQASSEPTPTVAFPASAANGFDQHDPPWWTPAGQSSRRTGQADGSDSADGDQTDPGRPAAAAPTRTSASLAVAVSRARTTIAPVARWGRRHPLEAVAVLLLGVGGVVFPPVWLAGALVALASRRWDSTDKWLGLASPVVLTVLGLVAGMTMAGHNGFVHELHQGWVYADVISRLTAFLSAVYLAWRSTRARRVPVEPPWNRLRDGG